MRPREQAIAARQRAWQALGAVETDPRVAAWLKEIDFGSHALQPRWKTPRALALAASVLLALGVAIASYIHLAPSHYETAIGEQRDVLLPDGSRVTLNTNTAIAVRYSSSRRYIALTRGEALFAVKHDSKWPFDVSAGGTLTRALGTEFNVEMRKSAVTVSVLEGAVQVGAAEGIASQLEGVARSAPATLPGMATVVAAALTKGEAVEVETRKHAIVAEKADIGRIDAWRARRLEFTNTPLTQAVDEFNRYSSTRVVIGSADLRERRVSGVFRIGDTDGFLFSLQAALGVTTYDSAGEVTLVLAPLSH